MIGKHITPGNADSLLEMAAGKSKAEIGQLLAARFASTEVMPMVLGAPSEHAHSPVPERVESSAFVTETSSGATAAPAAKPRVTPIACGRHLFQFMGDDVQRELLRSVQDLLGADGGDMGTIFFTGLALLKTRLEKRKFAATERPRRAVRAHQADSRCIPAHVRRAVRERELANRRSTSSPHCGGCATGPVRPAGPRRRHELRA